MIIKVHDDKAVAGHAHTATQRRNHRGGPGVGQGEEAGVHRDVDHRVRVRGAPNRSRNRALRKATQVSFKGGERMVRNHIVVQRRPEPQDVKNEALDPLPMRRGRRSRVMDGGGPLEAKRGSLNPEGELLKKMDDLRVS